MNKITNYGISIIPYGTAEGHILMTNPVGENGENITIMILSCNRSQSTIDLLLSIKNNVYDFNGEILIIDNNSVKEEKDKLKSFISLEMKDYKVNFVESEINRGVAGGRNFGIEYVNTEWVLSLDNDIYFTQNPFKEISLALSTLGCHFLNLSLLNEDGTSYFADGGHLYVGIDDISIGGGSLYKQMSIENNDEFTMSLSTFLFGGASLFNVETFKKMGKFDERFFIGFEDTDFSIRLFKDGYKIGNCHFPALIHNHKIPISEADNNYEKIRFSSDIIKESAMKFEEKWHFKGWNPNVEMWLFEKQKELGIINKNEVFGTIEASKKKKIALVVDVKGWAFYNIATQIKNNLSEEYDIDIIVMDYLNDIYSLFIGLYDYDHVHFFWRGHIAWLEPKENSTFVYQYGMTYDYFYKKYVKERKNKITTSVYDHLFINNDEEVEYTNKILSKVGGYTVSSNKLKDIYEKGNFVIKPDTAITDGVDLNKFKPLNLERFNDRKNKKLIVGWVGNSLWQGKAKDIKGVNTILKPVLGELKNDGYNIENYFADRQERMIPHDEMPDYYSKIDVLICTSKNEGTPNPVLEAMACGVPVISTDVGIVPEVFGDLQKNYILNHRTKKCLKDKLIELYNNQNMLTQLSKENLNSIKNWDWTIKTNQFKQFFDKFFKKNAK
jgi:glycosyltransferase involved in cell wall biosynthesis